MNKNYFSARRITWLAILIALVVVLQLFASAIPMFGITLNFSLIPIAIAGIVLGVIGGTIVGLCCGVTVFITTAVMGQEPSTVFFFQAQPVILTIMCMGKTTIAGAMSGLMYKLLEKKNKTLGVYASSLVIPIFNTGIYMLGIVLMKDAAAQFLALDSSSAGVVFSVVFGMIWLNFVLEIAVNVVFAPMIYRVIRVIDKVGDR